MPVNLDKGSSGFLTPDRSAFLRELYARSTETPPSPLSDPVNRARTEAAWWLSVTDRERLEAAMRRASEAAQRMAMAFRDTVWGREDAMRWTPPPDGDAEEVPRWLA